jgi:hypothetical protein
MAADCLSDRRAKHTIHDWYRPSHEVKRAGGEPRWAVQRKRPGTPGLSVR